VEYFHHLGQLQTARRELKIELEENRQILESNRRDLHAIETELDADMALLRSSKPSAAPLAGKLDYSWIFRAPRDAAWQGARQNGSLDLMPHTELQGYAHLYAIMGDFMQILIANGQRMDEAAATAKRAKNGPVTAKDIEDLTAATTAAQGTAIDVGRVVVFEEQALRTVK
jgi:hypothetical protein